MARRKKYPKLPNGFGSIRYLGAKRRNPYAVQPPSVGLNINGQPIRPKPLCYVDDWYKGIAVLTAYNAGNYVPGMENDINLDDVSGALHETVQKILTNYAQINQRITGREVPMKMTFAELYKTFYDYKFNQSKRIFSQSCKGTTTAAFKKLSILHNKDFRSLRLNDLQAALDQSPARHAQLEHMCSLIKQMYKYADARELCDKDYSVHLRISQAEDEEHGVAFTENEIRTFWEHRNDPTAEMLLIMCYSGHRISEYKVIEVDLKDNCFLGGLKTKAGKGRVVPIHPFILPFVKNRLKQYGCMLCGTQISFRKKMTQFLQSVGIDSSHTPHDARHTFSALCERYGVSESDRKRMLGHSFGSDVTNAVYGHRTLEDLRASIEKIPALGAEQFPKGST